MQERRTIGETKEALEFMAKVDQLSPQQREHLRVVVKGLIECYLHDDYRAVLIAGRDGEDKAELMTVNCTEMEAGVLVSKLGMALMDLNTVDAPPKEMMN
jgi:hypothetical protein